MRELSQGYDVRTDDEEERKTSTLDLDGREKVGRSPLNDLIGEPNEDRKVWVTKSCKT